MKSKRLLLFLGFGLLSIGGVFVIWLLSGVIGLTVGGFMAIVRTRILISQGVFAQAEKLENEKIRLDVVNLKKLASIWVAIGVGLAVIEFVSRQYIGIPNWALIALIAWPISGGIYSNRVLKSGSWKLKNIAINGAILAAMSEVVHQILSSFILSIQYPDSGCIPWLYVSGFLQPLIMGEIGATAWYAFKAGRIKIDDLEEPAVESQANNVVQELPNESSSLNIQWSPWPLLAFAGAPIGGLVFSMLFCINLPPLSIALGGVIGGVLAGFTPWLSQTWRISKGGSQALSAGLIVSILGMVVYSLQFGGWSIFVLILFLPPTVIVPSVVALITRVLCRRWLKSQSHWWEWVLAGILILGLAFGMMYLLIIGMFSQ